MASSPRLFLAAAIVAASACGLVYDVDSITANDTCGQKNAACCAGGTCGDGLVCVTSTLDAGTDAGCDCPEADGAAGAALCSCESKICKPCGGPSEPCCEHSACLGDDLTCTDSVCTGTCGMVDGAACCNNTEKPCAQNLTCEDKVCHTACGALGQACCVDACNAGLACQGGSCQPPVVGECGGLDQPCCTTGTTCDQTNLKCNGSNCVACGGEGQPCCDNPQCSAGSLTCDGGGICRTCPYAGATCGGDGSKVCMGTGGGEQCQVCGGLGNPCCSSSVVEPCPNQLYCCNGTAADGCTSCSGLPCTCKVCCVRCVNWQPGNYQKIPALPGQCDSAGIAHCSNAGGKAFAQFRTACPP
jgi:hypothetical protein